VGLRWTHARNIRKASTAAKAALYSAFAWRSLLDRQDGAALIGVDPRHIEPGALLRELDIALAVGVDIGQADSR
jgi:hypothetical protein